MGNTGIFPIVGPWPGSLAILTRPRAGDWLDDDIAQWKAKGIGVVVCLLTRDELTELDLTEEGSRVQSQGLTYYWLPIPDRSTPSDVADVIDVLGQVTAGLREGKQVGVHCRQGLGRAPLIAASLLAMAGVDPETAFEQIEQARGVTVPETPAQRAWVHRIMHSRVI